MILNMFISSERDTVDFNSYSCQLANNEKGTSEPKMQKQK